MGTPNYPRDWATEWNRVQTGVRTAMTAARTRIRFGSIEASDIIIRGGSLKITDDAGDTVVHVGKLPDGSYGLAAIEAGKLVKLSTLAFGIRAATVQAQQGTASQAWTNLATIGPRVNVTIGTSGRCVALPSCQMLTGDRGGKMGVEVTGATTIDPQQSGFVMLDAAGAGINAAHAILLTGLNPGVHTLTAKYAALSPSEVSFSDRNLIAIPF